jgi:opacity protein-like surface antigen
MRRFWGVLIALALGAVCAAPATAEDDSSGFYAGAAVGVADVRSDGYANVDYYGFDQTHVGWKVFTGIRPMDPLGLEAEFIDFGNPSTGAAYSYSGASSDAKAGALFVVGYLPMPLPLFDVFAKVGLARLDQNTTVNYPIACSAGHECAQYVGVLKQTVWTTAVAYGGGLQAKFGALAVRAEYERISGNSGEPDIISVGASWTF